MDAMRCAMVDLALSAGSRDAKSVKIKNNKATHSTKFKIRCSRVRTECWSDFFHAWCGMDSLLVLGYDYDVPHVAWM